MVLLSRCECLLASALLCMLCVQVKGFVMRLESADGSGAGPGEVRPDLKRSVCYSPAWLVLRGLPSG